MPRGQYDRAAAKAKRENKVASFIGAEAVAQMADANALASQWPKPLPRNEADWDAIAESNVTSHDFVRPAWPYTNGADFIIAPQGTSDDDMLRAKVNILKSDLDAANALIAKYAALLKRHGLWLDE